MPSLNQADQAEKVKVIYTSAEIETLGIQSAEVPPEPTKCKFCGKILYYEGVVSIGRVICWRRSFPQRCTCDKAQAYWRKYDADQDRKRQDAEKAEKNREMQERIDRLIGKSGIKKRFLTRTFENFEVNKINKPAFDAAKKYADEFEIYESEGKGIYFEGTYGSGKTHLAVAIALQLMHKGIPVIYKTSIDLLADIKNAYDNSGLSEKSILDIYKNVNLLVIDDLGKEQCTSWSMPILYSILNDRYEDMKPIIITSNYNEEMLAKRLVPKDGDSSNVQAIISRLRECTDVVTMAWDDYRGVKNE